VIGAAVVWGVTLPVFLKSELALRFGADFVHYYTLGWVALHRTGELLYDPAGLHGLQASLVPSLADHKYPTPYPPQFSLLFAPFALVSFAAASALWISISVIMYVATIWRAAERMRALLSDPVLFWAATIAFPPFWYLMLFRQNSMIVLAVLFIGCRLFEDRRPLLAGLALGFLALKPQFGIPFAFLALYRRDVRLIVGAVISTAVQVVTAASVFGIDVLAAFLQNLPRIIGNANVIEPVYKSISMRSLSRALPSPLGESLWVLACIAVLFAMLRASRAHVPVRLQLALVILASILVNPHVYIYDGVVLVLPLIWLGEWRLEREEGCLFLYQTLGFCCAAVLMMPLSLVFGSSVGVVAASGAILALITIFWSAAKDVDAHYSPDRFGYSAPASCSV
jgi:hypothetical protein